jgi:hypothetical protein
LKNSADNVPVFVLGCARSGTTLLYHMLLSSGGFAIYRAETHIFNVLLPRFGGFSKKENRRKALNLWLQSQQFRISGLDPSQIESRILSECHSGGDFLRIVMDEVARNQGVKRWAECTPEHLLYVGQIKREVPEAKIIHIIRDGRDVALSFSRQGWTHPLPWDRGRELLVAGAYWKWFVARGRSLASALGPDYLEVRFEDLLSRPVEVLSRISPFIHHNLDHEEILRSAIGSVGRPNTSFPNESTGNGFDPAGRWKRCFSESDLETFEALTGDLLEELGYPLATIKHAQADDLEALRIRTTYSAYFDIKQWLKAKTPLGRLTSTSLFEDHPKIGQDIEPENV